MSSTLARDSHFFNCGAAQGAHRGGRHQKAPTNSALKRAIQRTRCATVATAAFVIAVSLGLLGAGATDAYFTSTVAATPASTISSGTATLSVGAESLNWSNLAPGNSVTGTFTITNTGDVPLALSATTTTTMTTMTPPVPTNPFTISVANGACPAAPGVPAGSLSGTLAAGATTSACLVVTLPANAPSTAQSANAAISTTISGVQP